MLQHMYGVCHCSPPWFETQGLSRCFCFIAVRQASWPWKLPGTPMSLPLTFLSLGMQVSFKARLFLWVLGTCWVLSPGLSPAGELASQASELTMSFVGRINPTHTPPGFWQDKGRRQDAKLHVCCEALLAPTSHLQPPLITGQPPRKKNQTQISSPAWTLFFELNRVQVSPHH